MNQLTNRELLLLEENLKLEASMATFAQSCVHLISDPQLRALCQRIAQDHHNDYQELSRHINMRNM
ncbi:MAG: spore coat protein [Syntrophomonadaceae bacterium]|nr:spore coat protein [Syntrophomonadaceae bacterium]